MTKASFFWMIRRWWHTPHDWSTCQPPDCYFLDVWQSEYSNLTTKENAGYLWWIYSQRPHGLKVLWRDIRHAVKRLWRWVRYTQPLHCNGNGGGWRTTFCEWIENKARQYEN